MLAGQQVYKLSMLGIASRISLLHDRVAGKKVLIYVHKYMVLWGVKTGPFVSISNTSREVCSELKQ